MSDYETIQRRRNIIVGIFVVAGMFALGWLIFKFGDMPRIVSKMGSYDVFIQLPQAPGVQRDTPVRFCGYQIGRVTAVRPPKVMKDLATGVFYHQTLIVLSIDKRFSDIPEDVEAKLMTRGLGSSYIELQLTHFDVNEPSGPFLADGGKLQGSAGVTSEFFPAESQKKLDELITSLIELIDNTKEVVSDPENKSNFKVAMANLAQASGEATERLRQAKDTLERIEEALKVASETIEGAQPAIEEIRKLAVTGSETLKSTETKAEKLIVALVDVSEQLGKSLSEARSILQKIDEGSGSAGRLVNDGKLYETLVEDTEQIEMLLKEIKAFVSRAREKGVPIKLK
ncbi:MAG: MCE family protein [Sedimentisphaerales bacterium]|nr:MCE family protein [Sedimentisphaerales bacterium]